jgi:outer membrane protein OmpA-like peptidoglycan-associated protein
LFDSGKYDLKADATKELQELAILLEEHPGLPVLIEGHTDSQGTPEANQVLSENRANAVKQWLTSNAGIASDRIMTNGYGQSVPVASNDTAEGRQKNRRVEIKLPKKPSNSTVGESR